MTHNQTSASRLNYYVLVVILISITLVGCSLTNLAFRRSSSQLGVTNDLVISNLNLSVPNSN